MKKLPKSVIVCLVLLLFAIASGNLLTVLLFGAITYYFYWKSRQQNNGPDVTFEATKAIKGKQASNALPQNTDEDDDTYGGSETFDVQFRDLPPMTTLEKQNAYTRRLRVAGVTFKNKDGSDRQELIKKLFNREAPFDTTLVLELEEFEYDGAPAYYVNVNGATLGTAPADMVKVIKSSYDRIRGVENVRVYSSYTNYEKEHIPYRATFNLKILPKSK